ATISDLLEEGFMLSDVGKTISFAVSSCFIVSIESSSKAQCILGENNLKTSTDSTTVDTWELFDGGILSPIVGTDISVTLADSTLTIEGVFEGLCLDHGEIYLFIAGTGSLADSTGFSGTTNITSSFMFLVTGENSAYVGSGSQFYGIRVDGVNGSYAGFNFGYFAQNSADMLVPSYSSSVTSRSFSTDDISSLQLTPAYSFSHLPCNTCGGFQVEQLPSMRIDKDDSFAISIQSTPITSLFPYNVDISAYISNGWVVKNLISMVEPYENSDLLEWYSDEFYSGTVSKVATSTTIGYVSSVNHSYTMNKFSLSENGSYVSKVATSTTIGYVSSVNHSYTMNKFSLSENGSYGPSVVRINTNPVSIICPFSGILLPLTVECSPATQLNISLAVSSSSTSAVSVPSAYETLPTNYRPPSKYGTAIPICSNIYNADPSEPMYNNVKQISQETGEYKQCLDKDTRDDCGCKVDHYTTSDPRHTDCIEQVVRVFYSDGFTPSFYVEEIGSTQTLFEGQVLVQEVNGRTDFCVDGVCDHPSDDSGLTLDLSGDGVISWKGAELFHLQFTAILDSYCALESYAIVWVYEPPVQSVTMWVFISLTVAGFAVAMFFGYLHHYNTNEKRF
ncbi:Cation channel sperm-associated protein subunit beta like protein, partial [Aduncisulcus paluster]